ncbi:GAF and ANTAR domain-containing protein [Kribbella qitaiheensis]|uniref:GAF and ANTAR domain-containing protein n=1 Tax=Kribbella qitaiheensis TaxID=1544730 RepID=A0A7G6WW98_9ACTN|nr:GAF and ANTAR domain-containing protein [Kribbella qitaiheensis]QNE18263.1 GAF and ANTAR domain-containing protein [Kribbella qitaiheensis]
MSGTGHGTIDNTSDVFADLAMELYESVGVEHTAAAVLQFVLPAVGCSHAAMVLAHRSGRPAIAAVTDPIMETVSQLQMDTGDGPLIVALADGIPVLVRDSTTDARWPEWATKTCELGLRTVLQVPLRTGQRTTGVLTFGSSGPDAFDAGDEAIAHILGLHAAIAMGTARHEETLHQAADARKLIGQAMGILMERYSLDDEQAFATLRRYSQDNNIKLHTVALRLIATRNLPGRSAPPSNSDIAQMTRGRPASVQPST